jgi:imidazolonepropionase-like amidohydrolase
MASIPEILGIYAAFRVAKLMLPSRAARAARRAAGRPRSVAIAGVDVVAVDRGEVLRCQDVVVEDGRITKIGPTQPSSPPPAGVPVIDGRGKYLIPGLTDMHVHVAGEHDLGLFLASGVTTVRNMWGFTGPLVWMGMANQLTLGARVERGEVLGPRIVTAGPILDGRPPNSPLMKVVESAEQGRLAVQEQAEKGYDFIKVYDNLTPETYAGIMAAAKAAGLPVAGHVPAKVGLDAVLGSGLGQVSIEHLTGYLDYDLVSLLVPGGRLVDYARKTRDAGVWNCPSVVVFQKRVPPGGLAANYRQQGMEHVSLGMKLFWPIQLMGFNQTLRYRGADYAARMLDLQREVIGALHGAGAGIVAGTDAGNPFVVPGVSLLEELRHLVDLGLSPLEALRTATCNAAAALGRESEAGTVSLGKVADLVLLDTNPLEDIGHLARIAGVAVRGLWLTAQDLAELRGERRRAERKGRGSQ